MQRTKISLKRPLIAGAALALLSAGGVLTGGSLIVGCGTEQQDPVVPNNNAGSSAGGSSSGGMSAGGSAGDAQGGAGGSGGDGGGNNCPLMGQIPDAMSGECTCPPYIPTACEAAMKCTEVMEDPEHCGMCDNACDPGAACNAGVCTTAPAPVASFTDCMTPRMILAGTSFYLTDAPRGVVASIAIADGTVTELSTGEMSPGPLAADATHLYWSNTDATTPAIKRIPLGGGTAETLLTTPALVGPAHGIAISGDLLYFTHVNDVFSIPVTGAAAGAGDAGAGVPPDEILVEQCPSNFNPASMMLPEPGAPIAGANYITGSNESCFTGGDPMGLAANATNLLYTVAGREAVEANLLDGSLFLKLGASQGSLNHDVAALSDTTGYWAAGDHIQQAALEAGMLGMMGEVPNEQLVATLEFDNVTGLTLSATHAYISGANGGIMRAALATPGMMAEPLAIEQEGAKWLVNDGTNVYWINGNCSINSIPLAP